MKEKIIIASSNPHKIEKLSWIVEGLFKKIEKLKKKVEINENGSTFKANAEIKARIVSKLYKNYAIATDGGVLIPSLGNNWNEILTRRFLGEKNITDKDRIEGLLELMKDKVGSQRKIIWKEAIAIANKGRVVYSTEVRGDWGILQTSYNPKQYKKGIWVCTLWSYPQFGGRNFFDLTEEEKKYGERSWWKLRKRARKYFTSLKTSKNY